MKELELHAVSLDTERRWNWQQHYQEHLAAVGTHLGRFLSWCDDDAFVWLQTFDDPAERRRMSALLAAAPPRRSESVRRLRPVAGGTVTSEADLGPLTDSAVIEIRQYRLVPGTRERFTRFLLERTLAPQRLCGMAFFGPFDDLDDADVLTWFRGFPGLAARDRMKAAFYQGSLWLEELEAEAFTMIEDYSNTMLVTPA